MPSGTLSQCIGEGVVVMLADSVVVANFVVLFVPVHMKVFDGMSHF